jgi:hypothetical protein
LAGLARSAIIASRDALFGMARMFEVFAENAHGSMIR